MSFTVHPHRHRELQRLHEINYQLVMKLVPHLRQFEELAVSQIDDGSDLHLRIIEHSPYTTVIALTHHVMAGPASLPVPDLWMRVCHDAKVAEAIAHQDGAGPAHTKDTLPQHGLDTEVKWQLNTFAEKWLKQCLQQGHRFCLQESYSSSLSA